MLSIATRSLVVSTFAVCPLIAATPLAGQAADQNQPIPRELALALLNFGPGMSGGPDILVGRAPDDIPPELVPPDLEVLGSTTRFESAVIVLAARQQPDSATSAYEARLIAAGWTKPPIPPMRPMRGFVAADAFAGQFEPPAGICRDKEYATYASWYRRNGGSIVKVTYNRGAQYSPCTAARQQQQSVTTYRSPYDEAPVPVLRAPFGAMSNRGGGMSSSGTDGFSIYTQLTTRMKPPEVVAHYDKQMRDQGWNSLGEGAVPLLAAHTYTKKDDQGRSWTGVLFSVAFPDSTKQDVTLRLVRSPEPSAK